MKDSPSNQNVNKYGERKTLQAAILCLISFYYKYQKGAATKNAVYFIDLLFDIINSPH